MKKSLRTAWLAVVMAFAQLAVAEAPANYYASCQGKKGAQLLHALEDVVSSHTVISYSGLWAIYDKTDTYPNGKIWDMYSTKQWTFSSDQCGNYSQVGDCYNREHSMPKSWFNDRSPMVSDAFHIYPTDGRVNGQRSNYPYGECASGTTLSAPSGIKALGKLGSCTFPGYTGTVFEPDDQYKGDFARTYFYMAACYNSYIDDWDSPMLVGNSYPAFTSWAVDLLMKWHAQDPVSQKEIDRNEAVYACQHNRNPFIDHPEMADHIWGSLKNEGWTPNATHDPEIVLPQSGSTIDFGNAVVGKTKEMEFRVKGDALDADVTLDIAGNDDVQLMETTVSAAAASSADGVAITVSWTPSEAGALIATLIVKSGSAQSQVSLIGTAYDGITALEATGITSSGFVSGWVYVGDADSQGCYQLWVWPTANGASHDAQGTMKHDVVAERGTAFIDGLQPSTAYSYQVFTVSQQSNIVNFRTGEAIPSIQLFLAPGTVIDAAPGQPSQALGIGMVCENIFTDITVAVEAPFQVSTDKSQWTQQVSIDPDDEGFYVRVLSDAEGEYSTYIKMSAGSYLCDDYEISAKVKAGAAIADAAIDTPDAYCRGGRLVIEAPRGLHARVYGVDGVIIFEGKVAAGYTSLDCASGLYIVAVEGMSHPKRVVVR